MSKLGGWSRVTFSRAALALMLVPLACMNGGKAPHVAPGGTLGLRQGDTGASVDKGPFRVLYASPVGELKGPSEITVLFSKPMRALGVAGAETAFPAKIDPPVKGTWQWVGTRAASFVPARPDGQIGGSYRLPGATKYVVTLPRGTAALDGEALTDDYTFSFSTEPPGIVSTDPWNDANDLEPNATWVVRFNQPIADDEIARAGHLMAGATNVAFDVKRDKPEDLKEARLVPRSPLPLNTALKLTFDASLASKDGPVHMGSEAAYAFRTYGPLQVDAITCNDTFSPHGKCDPTSGLTISLTNPVKYKDLKKAVSIDGVKVGWPSYYPDDEDVSTITVGARFRAAGTYTVHVAPPLTDAHGQSLASVATQTLHFDDFWPLARIGMNDGLLEAKGSRRDPIIASVNADDLEIVASKLTEDDLLELESETGPMGFDALSKRAGAKVHSAQKGTLNTVVREKVSIGDVLGGAAVNGPFAIGIRYSGGRSRGVVESHSIAQVTDLAMTAKVSRAGTLVWVTRLSDASAVAGAEVRIRRPGDKGVTSTTDAQGFATFSATDFQPSFEEDKAIVFAYANGDTCFKALNDNVESSDFSAAEDGELGLVFSDRGIYRPGDLARLKGIIRQEVWNGTAPPTGKTARVVVAAPTGDKVFEGNAALTAFGTFSIDVPVPQTAALGGYEVTATTDARTARGVSASFEVAEYRPVEFEVHAESDRPSYVRGDDAKWMAHGDFLFGAPMSGSDAHTTVTRSETSFAPDDTDGFEVSDRLYYEDLPDTTPRESVIATGNGRLDAKGASETKARLSLPAQRGPESVTCAVDVTDLSRQVVSSSTTAIVHPAAYYLGIKLDDAFVDSGTSVKPTFIAVTPKGERLEGKRVKVQLLRRKWVVSKEAKGDSGLSTVASVVDTEVGTCTVSSTARGATCDLKPNEGGYYIVRATSKDALGNDVAASVDLYATGATGGGWYESDKTDVSLVADKTTYSVGDKARVLVKSPFASAVALVTVERGGVYDKRVVTLSGATPTIEVPITEEMRPNAYVSVVLTRGRTKPAPGRSSDPDVGAPAYRVGFTDLTIDPTKKRLGVALKPSKPDLGPGDELSVDVDVKDATGKPTKAEVTLYAVDEGVLSLIHYKTPDPVKVFAEPRELKVATLESRSRLIALFDPLSGLGGDKGLAGGGGGAPSAGGGSTRHDFRASAYFNPAIVTDEKGHASVSFKLPDAVTTYRVMAVVASADDRFGYAEKRVTTSQPLMARPELPRFLRAGDVFDAGVIVTSRGASGDMDVALKATGVAVTGETSRRVHLDVGESTEVRFAMAASDVGTATFHFDVKGGGLSDSVEVTRNVHVPMTMETVALYGSTSSEAVEKLGDLGGIRPDAGDLTINTSSSALVGLDGAADQLLDYPYGCSEQLTSRLVPIVTMRSLATDFRIKLPANVDDVVATTVAQILKHQRSDGGFGLWPDSPESNIWVTAYVFMGLKQAQAAGVNVPNSVFDSAVEFMHRDLDELEAKHYGPAAQAFVMDVLAQYDKADPGRIARLFEVRSELPLFAKALLLHSMVFAKSDATEVDTLTHEVESSLRLDGAIAKTTENVGDGYAELLDSETRTSALVLRALLAVNPGHPLGAPLAMGLLANRQGSAWRTTQETAWSLMALVDYRKAQETAAPAFDAHLFLGEDELAVQPFRGRSLKTEIDVIPSSRLGNLAGAPLGFRVDGGGKLFYEARLRYARKVLPTDVIDHGFYVEKRLRKVTADTLDAALETVPDATTLGFGGGDLVLTDLVVVSPEPRDFVVIDDALPAGFEAIDTRLATTSPAMSAVDRRGKRRAVEDSATESQGWYRKEVHDDRVLFFADHMVAGIYRYRYLARATSIGTFVVPPTKAEEMYAPEIFGRTGSASIEVKP